MSESSERSNNSSSDGTLGEADKSLIEDIVKAEWHQFQGVNNEGGPANCQGNWPTFFQMRASQFMTWDRPLLESYRQDLAAAEQQGRNLLTEKYARMMESTDPAYYRRELEAAMPVLSPTRVAQQEAIIAQQVAWADDFRGRYPKLGLAMRVLRTSEDTVEATSFETYLRAELGTYSQATLDHYERLIERDAAAGVNLTEQTIRHTVRLGGYSGLAEAEAAQ